MTEYSKGMTNCMGSLSELSDEELAELTKGIENERKNRINLRRKAIITNAIMAMRKVYEFSHYLEIETENGMQDIYLTDIEAALEDLR